MVQDLTPGEYLTDGKEHSLFGYGEPGHWRFGLSFTAPLLIECGFPFDRETLERYVGYQSLHPDENSYLKKCPEISEIPRRLDLQCRDTLRKYFHGRYIHDFVAASNILKLIQDFILLRNILRYVLYSRLCFSFEQSLIKSGISFYCGMY